MTVRLLDYELTAIESRVGVAYSSVIVIVIALIFDSVIPPVVITPFCNTVVVWYILPIARCPVYVHCCVDGLNNSHCVSP